MREGDTSATISQTVQEMALLEIKTMVICTLHQLSNIQTEPQTKNVSAEHSHRLLRKLREL